jgi:tryptophanyl-tRNA synthetase
LPFTMTTAEPEAPTETAPPVAEGATAPAASKQVVDPWNVAGEIGEDGKAKAIDYRKLVEEFGTKLIDQELLDRFERVTGHKPHRFLRRQIVFSERDLGLILDRYEKVRIEIKYQMVGIF